MALNEILAGQTRWAGSKWPAHHGRRAPSLEENLFMPLPRQVRQQFVAGKGGELGRPGHPGKMSSLRSSSALAFNFFAPWIGHDLAPLGRALGVSISDNTMCFERSFAHGLPSTPPHLDVVLDNGQLQPCAIECKFTEPYGHHRNRPPIEAKYFTDRRARWSEVGLPRCQIVASELGHKRIFRRFDAGQLLKHMLGLAFSTQKPPRITYLWYEVGSSESREHANEITLFSALIDETVTFNPVTYQRAFRHLSSCPEPDEGYLRYLGERYFSA